MKLNEIMVQMLREAVESGLDGISSRNDFTDEQHEAIARLYEAGLIRSDVEPRQRFRGYKAKFYVDCTITEAGREALDDIDDAGTIRGTVDEHKQVIILIINLSVEAGHLTPTQAADAKSMFGAPTPNRPPTSSSAQRSLRPPGTRL